VFFCAFSWLNFSAPAFDGVYPELAEALLALRSFSEGGSAAEGVGERAQGSQKKSSFLFIFLLTLFENTLKYPHVSQKANISRP